MSATTRERTDPETQRKMRRFDKFLNGQSDTLTAWFGAADVPGIRQEMDHEYLSIIPEVPYVGGRHNRYTPSLELAGWALAVYRVLQRHGGSVERVGRLLHDYAKSTYQRIPKPVRVRMLRPRRARAEKQARWTQERRYAADWLIEIVDGDGRSFDWGVDISECGLVKFLDGQGAAELTPYLCDLDYVMAEAAGVGLTRTKTLAWGCDRCDFRWQIPGTTTAPWPPSLAERRAAVS